MVLDSCDVEHQKLWLPSELPVCLHEKGCLAGVAEIEARLHEAQCQDALGSLRSMPCARHSLFSHHNKNFWGQKQNMRAAETAHHLDKQCRLAGAKYNAARAALKALQGAEAWEENLRELKSSDMSLLHGSVLEIDEDEDEDELVVEGSTARKCARKMGPPKEVGEGHREISWIWVQEGALGDGSDKALMQGNCGKTVCAIQGLMGFNSCQVGMAEESRKGPPLERRRLTS